jgi:hypothetical protein
MKKYKTFSEKLSEEFIEEVEFSEEFTDQEEFSKRYFEKVVKYPSKKILKIRRDGLESLKKVENKYKLHS